MKEELLRLADRCEKATGPDRELDGAIHFAAILRQPCPSDIAEIVEATEKFDDSANWVARYTASLDAAMTLAGEDLSFWFLLTEAAKRCALTAESGTEGEFRRRLPAFVAAAALRASVKEQNNGK